MDQYKHTQIGYLTILLVFVLTIFFIGSYISAMNEPVSIDSGANLLVTAVGVFVLAFAASFTTLSVSVDNEMLRVKFGYGIFRKKFLLNDIDSVTRVKNKWYYGFGVRVWFRPYMQIYNVSGFDAVEIILKNSKRYRIGTDDPVGLESALVVAIKKYK